jgi:hypothetical protein
MRYIQQYTYICTLYDVDQRMEVGVARKKEAQGVHDDADGEDAGAGELPVGFGESAEVLDGAGLGLHLVARLQGLQLVVEAALPGGSSPGRPP